MSAKEKNLTSIRKKRGVIRASVTRLANRLSALEKKINDTETLEAAQQSLQRLNSLNVEFKVHHFELIDLIDVDDHEATEREQDILDTHEEDVAEATIRIKRVITNCKLASDPFKDRLFTANSKLSTVESHLGSVRAGLDSLSGLKEEIHLIRQYEDEIAEVKAELSSSLDLLFEIKLGTSHELFGFHAALKKDVFGCSLKLKELLHGATCDTSSLTESGVRLPKLEVPTFDGNLLNWRSFWDQFKVSVHDRTSISDSEKLVYLQSALKDGTAKGVIEGLTRSGDFYAEAVESLCSRYDRPRLVHQTHVKMIMDAPALKSGNGKELRCLHDLVQQHLRALKALGYEPSGPFITAMLELKLDVNTAFEWQKHSYGSADVPHYSKLLEFLNLRAQASETSSTVESKKTQVQSKKSHFSNKVFSSHTAGATDTSNCVLCKSEKHPLYVCGRFKSLPNDKRLSILREHGHCLNCLRPGHFVRECKSVHRCQKCQKPHHTLIHSDFKESQSVPQHVNKQVAPTVSISESISSNIANGAITSNALLMTCRVIVLAPDGSNVQARALLDSGSSVSFISERLAQALRLKRTRQNARISGIAGLCHDSSIQSIATFAVTSAYTKVRRISVTAVVMPRVTNNLPLRPLQNDGSWDHLNGLQLADPDFGSPGKIDVLLGVDVFVDTLLYGRRSGRQGSPTALETVFGWVLAGGTSANAAHSDCLLTHHVSFLSGDNLLRKFWELEEGPKQLPSPLSPLEKSVLKHFEENHTRTIDGRFVVPLPKQPAAKDLGESRSQAVRRFLVLERSLHAKGQFKEVDEVVQEYFQLNHAELVPVFDLNKPVQQVFYLPIHAVRKESSSTTKIRAVFDASAKSASGTSLNDTLLVGPTVHPPLVDVLLRFRFHRIALTTDVSKMYRAVQLVTTDKDLHRFVWRQSQDEPLRDYRMTRVTFGVSASSFAANMAVKQNALDHALEFPKAFDTVLNSFYVDDGLSGADSTKEAIELQQQLQSLFAKGGFKLHKWNSNDPEVLKSIADNLKDPSRLHSISDANQYSKTLGVKWNAHLDLFQLTVTDLPPLKEVTKRLLVSDIAKVFDVLGWFSPSIIKVKILLQKVWESKIDWDDTVPTEVLETWTRWRAELNLLSNKKIPRCYFTKDSQIISSELHGFCDASEFAYAAVVYLRLLDTEGRVQVALVTSKTKVAPIKRLTIPRLELCGAHLLAQLLHHVNQVLMISLSNTYAWTDSTIVLNWLDGSPRRFKTYVGNRVSAIVDHIPPSKWQHVNGLQNPADCASRGLFPSELLEHDLWWNGPRWLKATRDQWPEQHSLCCSGPKDEEREVALHSATHIEASILQEERYSSFTRLKRVTAWVLRFLKNCRIKDAHERLLSSLSVNELQCAEDYWIMLIQDAHFHDEMQCLKMLKLISTSSPLIPLNPLLDSKGILRVGGRQQLSKIPYEVQHPVILHGKDSITRVIIRTEHTRLLHAGSSLLAASLSKRYYILRGRKVIRSIVRQCVTCRRISARPRPQILGQLPIERVTPGSIFEKVGVDYAGPILLKLGHTRKPIIVKSYICLFVSLTVKAVHLEPVSDLTTEAFLACLRRFISRRGKPSLIWSDNGTNFIGASNELSRLFQFLQQSQNKEAIADFLSIQKIEWRFIPQRSPHFGGLWEAAVKSMKTHLKKVTKDVKLTFEELSTVLTQIESCLNSRPLVPLSSEDDDGIAALTPGHFLIGRPLESLPDVSSSHECRDLHILHRWELCQALVKHFWKRWSTEYVVTLNRLNKWQHPTRNIQVGGLSSPSQRSHSTNWLALGQSIVSPPRKGQVCSCCYSQDPEWNLQTTSDKVGYYITLRDDELNLIICICN